MNGVYNTITRGHCNATRCNTLQHTATHCNTMQRTAKTLSRKGVSSHVNESCLILSHEGFAMLHVATHCNIPQHTATYRNTLSDFWDKHVNESCLILSREGIAMLHAATHCNTLQHTAIQCNIPQRLCLESPICCNATRCNTMQHNATYRVAKMHRVPYLPRSLSAKEPYNEWLFCEKRPAT